MGNSVSTYKVLVIGPPRAGKTHFLDMFAFGNDSTKVPTIGFYETSYQHDSSTRVEFHECARLECLELRLHVEYDMIMLIVRADSNYEQLQKAKNMLFQTMKHIPRVCVLYNHINFSKNQYTLKERNKILQLSHLQQIRPLTIIDIDISDVKNWAHCTLRLIQWLTGRD